MKAIEMGGWGQEEILTEAFKEEWVNEVRGSLYSSSSNPVYTSIYLLYT